MPAVGWLWPSGDNDEKDNGDDYWNHEDDDGDDILTKLDYEYENGYGFDDMTMMTGWNWVQITSEYNGTAEPVQRKGQE